MDEKELQKCANDLLKYINKDIKIIARSKKEYDIKLILEQMKNLSSTEMDYVIGSCINEYLITLSKYKLDINTLKKLNRNSDDIIDCIVYKGYESVMEEAEIISDDLIMKLFGYNNRKLELPLDINIIKNHYIHSTIKEEDIQRTIIYIVLNLSAICYNLDKVN